MKTLVTSSCQKWCVASTILFFLSSAALADPTAIPFMDAFEDYPGTIIVDTNGVGTMNGWYGEPFSVSNSAAFVVTNTVANAAGYPLPQTNHIYAMEFQGVIRNSFDTNVYYTNGVIDLSALRRRVYVDCMLRPGWRNDETPPADDVQVGVYVNTNGQLCVWHASYGTNTWSDDGSRWTELATPFIASDQWARVTITLDYLAATNHPVVGGDYSEVEHYFQVQLNGGPPITNARGFKTAPPDQPVLTDNLGGSWFLCADSGFYASGPNNRFISGLELDGVGIADDVVVTTNEPAFANYVIAITNGPNGQIDPPGPSVTVLAGFDRTFDIVPDQDYLIDDVLVDGASIGATNRYTFVGVTSNRSISVTFRPIQVISPLDTWLIDNGCTNEQGQADAGGDLDGDRSLNWEEYYAGTDPQNPTSVFHVVSQRFAASSNTLAIFATPDSGVTSDIHVYRSTNLNNAMGGWVLYGTNQGRAASGTNWWQDMTPPPSNTPVFYMPVIPTNP